MHNADAAKAMSDKEDIVAPKKMRPKDAATLILVRRDAKEPRMLMGQRHGGMAFMANKYVFPGGRMDPGDQRITAGGDLRPEIAARLTKDITPAKARGLALAAIRETFEETGVIVGTPSKDIPRTRSPGWKRYFAHGIVPELGRLELIGRAITPPNRSRRFDARFFMAESDCIAHTLDSIDNEELLTPCWVTFAEARALDLASITRRMVDEVEARLSEGADLSRPVPFFHIVRGKPHLDYL